MVNLNKSKKASPKFVAESSWNEKILKISSSIFLSKPATA